ncbi:MAG: MarR family transcriptional regulator [Reichenbachiella sp.]
MDNPLYTENSAKFNACLEQLMIKMEEADNSCIEITKDISKKEFAVVIFVAKNEEVIMKDIADYLGIPVSTTTGLIDKLEDKGFLKRVYSKEDRRSIKIALSKYGQNVHNLLMSTLGHMGATMLNGLTNNEQQTLISLLQKVAENLKDYTPMPASELV